MIAVYEAFLSSNNTVIINNSNYPKNFLKCLEDLRFFYGLKIMKQSNHNNNVKNECKEVTDRQTDMN